MKPVIGGIFLLWVRVLDAFCDTLDACGDPGTTDKRDWE